MLFEQNFHFNYDKSRKNVRSQTLKIPKVKFDLFDETIIKTEVSAENVDHEIHKIFVATSNALFAIWSSFCTDVLATLPRHIDSRLFMRSRISRRKRRRISDYADDKTKFFGVVRPKTSRDFAEVHMCLCIADTANSSTTRRDQNVFG